MRCAKSQKLYNIATVPLQICNSTNKCNKIFYCFIFFFSLLSLHFFFSLLSHSSVPSLLPQTSILSSQTSVCLSVSHSLFLSAPSPYSTSTPPCSPRRWRLPPRSPPSEIRSRGSSRSLSSSHSLSTRTGGLIGLRQRSCLGWRRWLLGWFVMRSGVGPWLFGVIL